MPTTQFPGYRETRVALTIEPGYVVVVNLTHGHPVVPAGRHLALLANFRHFVEVFAYRGAKVVVSRQRGPSAAARRGAMATAPT